MGDFGAPKTEYPSRESLDPSGYGLRERYLTGANLTPFGVTGPERQMQIGQQTGALQQLLQRAAQRSYRGRFYTFCQLL